jgi:hypothetical protein
MSVSWPPGTKHAPQGCGVRVTGLITTSPEEVEMSTPNTPDGTPDKLIDRFKEEADESVEDAREGEAVDNPV